MIELAFERERLSLDQAVRNVMGWTAASLADVVATVTDTPAKFLGLAERPGDRVVLDEHGFVVRTVVAGQCLYSGSGR